MAFLYNGFNYSLFKTGYNSLTNAVKWSTSFTVFPFYA